MHNSKIDQLLEFLKEEPNDPFTLYALALEYEKEEAGNAKTFYDLLLKEHPDYLATYYHAGKFYENTERETSMNIYQKGMELARKLGKTKTYNELQNALNLLRDLEEE